MDQGKKIQLLDDKVINKIAAGEVIENPGSVVKELVENSIDAGARSIRIEIRNGGKDYIKIADDGNGMNRADALICFQRHATSKLQTIEDLQTLQTLGFRGEALSSIAAVSRLTINTNKLADKIGTGLIIEGGVLKETQDISGFQGTTVEVRNLFFNVPVRRKYLKSRAVEFARIMDVVTKYALIHPEISFKLLHDSVEKLFSPHSSGSIENLQYLETITYILGKSVAKEMVPIEASTPQFDLNGYVSKPAISRKSTAFQFLFVNNRNIKSKLISNAIREAYGNLLFPKDHPFAILSFKIDPSSIDVNIHPTKKEIRFLDEEAVHDGIREAIREKLMKMKIIPIIKEDSRPMGRSSRGVSSHIKRVPKSRKLSAVLEDSSTHRVREKVPSEVSETDLRKLPKMYFVGQFQDTYLLMQDESNLYLIDQHAAAERITYEKLLRKIKARPLPTQKLIAPMTLELSPRESSLLQSVELLERLKKFGFDISHFGGNTFLVRSVPNVFGKNLDEKVILEFFDKLEPGKKDFKSDIQDDVLKLLACHSSIRAGEPLSESRALKLISELRKCDNPYNCPHGRPTIINFSVGFLEKKFKRIV